MALSKRVLTGLLAPSATVGLLAAQGARVRKTALRLPNAAGPAGSMGSGAPLNLVVLGDSVASGVGVTDHAETVAGRLGELLGESHAVRWTVLAESGFTAAEVTDFVIDRLADADVVVISVGVNDTKNLHSVRRWRRDLTALLTTVTAQAPAARVILLGLPPMETFPAMPRALGLALGARVRVMDRVGRSVAAGFPGVVRLELPRREFASLEDPFAADGFHPSATLHGVFAEQIHALLKEKS